MNTAEYIRALLERPRQYATYFNMGSSDKENEIAIACDLIDSLRDEDQIPVVERSLKARGPGNDPPDCEATLSSGSKLALEITELVDQQAIQKQVREGTVAPCYWTEELFIERLQQRLSAKERSLSDLHGGPYDLHVLVIHTDELLLTHSRCLTWLEHNSLDYPQPWDRSYLLFSYSPRYAEDHPHPDRGLPYLRIH